MQKLVMAFLFCLVSTIANAESFIVSLPAVCTDTDSLIKLLKETHEEVPIIVGQDSNNNSKYAFFINQKTKTWTFIQFDKDFACVLGNGENGLLYLGKKI